jgi:3''-phosphoadenosine 5''-phosphosulfate sulfotransferase (PAPS reductase)/FAD synthetase and related enzymes
MLYENEIDIPFYHVNTGYHHLETHELGIRLQERYRIKVKTFRPETSVEDYEAANGQVYRQNPGRCCHDRKYEVMRRIAPSLKAWIVGIRRDQSRLHAGSSILDWDERFGLIRIAPLARWTKGCVWEKIHRERIPYHSLLDQGYIQVSCAPCTATDLSDELMTSG